MNKNLENCNKANASEEGFTTTIIPDIVCNNLKMESNQSIKELDIPSKIYDFDNKILCGRLVIYDT